MKFSYFILSILFLPALFSCRSSRHAQATDKDSSSFTSIETTDLGQAAAATSFVRKMAENYSLQPCLTAKVKVKVAGVGKDLSVSGNLKMKRDEVVQLSLYFLGMEVGRLEFSPQEVLVIDRMNKQYVRASYSEVSFLEKADLDFYALQALFWNEVFVPGARDPSSEAYRFELSEVDGKTFLSLTDTPKLSYIFKATTQTALLESLEVKSNNSAEKGKFSFTYSNFRDFNGNSFPGQMKMAVTGAGKKDDMSLQLELSKLTNDDSWQTHTTVSDKYTRKSAEEILGRLFK